jgi:alcohol dehydrogenase class IV
MRQDADAVQGDHQTYSDGGLNLIYKGFESNRRILEGRRLFLVCRGSFDRLEIAEYIKSLDPVRFSDFTPNPKMEEAMKGVEMFRTSGCDTILAVGGGSPIDVAKCIKHYSGADVPIIAIPTTAGTGSEATHFAVVYKDKVKYSLEHDELLPDNIDGYNIATLITKYKKIKLNCYLKT